MAKTTFIATGDSFMTRRLSPEGYPGFDKLQNIIMQHDVRFNNLELTVHNHQGYPAAQSGGTWAMVEPEILDDLVRYGFNLYNTANNHSCDYSCGGVMATIDNLKKRNLAYAGTGATLNDAAAPGYLEVNGVRIALLSACSTCNKASVAGNRNKAIMGRPGLNPLRFNTTYLVLQEQYDVLKKVAKTTFINAYEQKAIADGYLLPNPKGKLTMGGIQFQVSEYTGMTRCPNEKDMARMEENIRIARQNADYVLISIHSHEFDGYFEQMPSEFLETFAHRCIDAGADAILGHGPHELRGIEIYQGKPIFYSLGNFIFQTETVFAQPADAYERINMPIDNSVEQFMDFRSKNGTRGKCVQENVWRSVMAAFEAEDGKITKIRLYPIDLHMELPRKEMGTPTLSDNDAVLHYLQTLCAPFGTQLEIQDNVATITL